MTEISVLQCFLQHLIVGASAQILSDVRIFSDNSLQEYLSWKYQKPEVHILVHHGSQAYQAYSPGFRIICRHRLSRTMLPKLRVSIHRANNKSKSPIEEDNIWANTDSENDYFSSYDAEVS